MKHWFKKTDAVTSVACTPLREMGKLNGVDIIEIETEGQKWIVRKSEVESELDRATAWREKIMAAHQPKMTRVALSAILKISPYVLRQKIKGIEEFFPDFTLKPKTEEAKK